MKNKKGILLPEGVRIIIAVLSILLLFYLAFQLFGLLQSKTSLAQAQEHMDKIEKIIKGLEEGESEIYLLLSPKGWALTGWPSEGYKLKVSSLGQGSGAIGSARTGGTYKKGEIPEECLDNQWEKCLCFCKKDANNNFLQWCNALDTCIEIDRDVFINENPNANENRFINVINEINISLKNNKLNIVKE